MNNADYPGRPFNEDEEEDWDRVMEINLKGVLIVPGSFQDNDEKAKRKIINISSVVG